MTQRGKVATDTSLKTVKYREIYLTLIGLSALCELLWQGPESKGCLFLWKKACTLSLNIDCLIVWKKCNIHCNIHSIVLNTINLNPWRGPSDWALKVVCLSMMVGQFGSESASVMALIFSLRVCIALAGSFTFHTGFTLSEFWKIFSYIISKNIFTAEHLSTVHLTLCQLLHCLNIDRKWRLFHPSVLYGRVQLI